MALPGSRAADIFLPNVGENMRLLHQVATGLLVAVLLGGCVTSTEKVVTRTSGEPVPVNGLNILFVKSALVVSKGGNDALTGEPLPTITFEQNDLGDTVLRDLPPKMADKGIRSYAAVSALDKDHASIKVARLFPASAFNYHLLIIRPVSASATCGQFGCVTRFKVSIKLLAPGQSAVLWESTLQEPNVFFCQACGSRFGVFVDDMAGSLGRAVVGRPDWQVSG